MRWAAAGTPYRSATAPRSVTPIPPVPIANPAIVPDAVAILRGKSSCAITIVTEKVETMVAPTAAAKTKTSQPLEMRKRWMRGTWRESEKKSIFRCPIRSARGPPTRVPTVPAPRNRKSSVATNSGLCVSSAR